MVNVARNRMLFITGNKPKIYSENSFIVDEQLAEDECLCEVCCDLIEANSLNEIDEALSCKHKVCANCWKLHLAAKCQQLSSTQVSDIVQVKDTNRKIRTKLS